MGNLRFYKKHWIETWADRAIAGRNRNDFYRILDRVPFTTHKGFEMCSDYDLVTKFDKTKSFGPLIQIFRKLVEVHTPKFKSPIPPKDFELPPHFSIPPIPPAQSDK
jgi:hypothetical protein